MQCCFEELNRHRGLAVWDAVLKSGIDTEGVGCVGCYFEEWNRQRGLAM